MLVYQRVKQINIHIKQHDLMWNQPAMCFLYIYIIYTYSRYCCSHAHDWTGFQKIGFHSQGWPIFRQDLCPGFVLNDPPQTPWFSRGFTHIYVCLQMWLCVHMYNMYVYNMYIYICVCTCIYIYNIIYNIEDDWGGVLSHGKKTKNKFHVIP